MPPFAGRHTASLMDDSRKARLIENTGLYIDSHELIKRKFRKILSWNETRRCFNLKKKDKFFIPYVRERRVYA